MHVPKVNITLSFDDSTVEEKQDIKFDNLGEYFTEEGFASGYSSLSIVIKNDSMYYSAFTKCGIPCSEGLSFVIKKKS